MKKCLNLLILIFILLSYNNIIAQTIADLINQKFDTQLKAELQRYPDVYTAQYDHGKAHDLTAVIVEITGEIATADLVRFNGKINTRTGEFATVRLPKTALVELAKLPQIKRIYFDAKLYPNNERAIQLVGADMVHTGAGNLPMGYTGQGVVTGIIDTGIDFLHEDFVDPADNTKSRIAYIWDQQNNNATAPQNYDYGAEWIRAQIEAELGENPPDLISPIDTNSLSPGHGTHVAGTMAGNKGLAYESEIIVVASELTFSGVLDGTNYIIQKAAEMGMPCVINMSFGTAFAPHDGLHGWSYNLDNMLEGSSGVVICAAAGNEGNRQTHWGGFELEADSSVVYASGLGGHGMYMIIPMEYADSIAFSLEAYKGTFDTLTYAVTAGDHSGQTPWKTISELAGSGMDYPFYDPQGTLIGEAFIAAGIYPEFGLADLYVWVNDGHTPYNFEEHLNKVDLYSFMVRGSGQFESWFGGYWPLTVTDPAAAGLPNDRYQAPDNDYGIGAPGSAHNILTVGAYTNRAEWTDADNNNQSYEIAQEEGELAVFSSRGPTLDGRIKPEIVAPGKGVISAIPSWWANEFPEHLLIDDTPHAIYQGTSFATPVVSGAVALLLQHDPELTYEEVRNWITDNAIVDDDVFFTAGPVPNGYWGYGKLDIYNTMNALLGLSAVAEAEKGNHPALQLYPNPADDILHLIRFPAFSAGDIALSIFDSQGQQVFSEVLPDVQTDIHLPELPSGMYYVSARVADEVYSGRFVRK